MKLFRASPEDVAAALLLPSPRSGKHDVFAAVEAKGEGAVLDAPASPVPARVPRARSAPAPFGYDVERQLADLAGVDGPLPRAMDDDDVDVDVVPADVASADFSHQLLRVAQVVAVGGLALVVCAAVLSAWLGSGSLHVHQLPFAGWAFAAAVSAVALAGRAGHDRQGTNLASVALLAVLVTSMSGVVASAGGISGPAWVLFLPVVLVCGAVVGPTRGLAVGAVAGAGIYVAAAISHTLTVAGAGRVAVILPACPAAGWAAGALARLARAAAAEAAARREALERDVNRLAEVLAAVAEGDLSQVPAPGDAADPVAVSLAVVFADTLLALRRLVRQMDGVTTQLASSAEQMSDTATQHVGAVEAQTSAVAETTTTVEQLAATAGAIADIAVNVSQFAGSTRCDVDTGAAAVEAVSDAMDRIATRVQDLAAGTAELRQRIDRVGESTRLIDDLARRTTILAVNASIEAARAGDQGHGFSTVAAEVDTLAARARAATAAIGDILTELETEAAATARASEEGLAAVIDGAERQAEVVKSLHRISAMVDRTTAAAREITEATRQQRFASDAVVAAMVTVTESSARYRSGSHGHAESAKRMHDLVAALKTSLQRFRVS